MQLLRTRKKKHAKLLLQHRLSVGLIDHMSYLNVVHKLGPLYLITRDTGTPKSRVLAMGFMRQTSPPWGTGKGIQLRIGKYVTQLGIWKNPKELSEQDGLLHAMQGRVLNVGVDEIGEW